MNLEIQEKQGRYDTEIRLVTEKQAEEIRDFEGRSGSVCVRYEGDTTYIYAALGEEGDLLNPVAAAVRVARNLKRKALSLYVERSHDFATYVQGALLGAYRFEQYKETQTPPLEHIEFVGTGLQQEALTKGRIFADATNYTRDLVNKNAGEIYPDALARQAQQLAMEFPALTVTVFDEEEIAQEGLSLLSAVGQGSATPPRFILLEYQGAAPTEDPRVLVGKGITFDAGGQNLKPSGSIENMRLDMAGAGAVLGIMKGICRLGLQENIVGVIPAAQNALGKDAYYTGDVYPSHAGKTVEVLNTDAEGRLVLADAISYCRKAYRPREIIDMATLTGAMVVALGDTVSGLFTNTPALSKGLFQAGEAVRDRLWELPVYTEHMKAMESDIADLRNVSTLKRKAGSITAAAFLHHFAEEVPWAHLDIAGTAWNDAEPRGITPKYATGAGVRVILEYLQRQQGEQSA
ncbi:leucyl aminopeptidase family protein [Chitinivibrio alkaliphilus]|uniref:Probable cytosol aminopeptidase n=1 Tax=Chitinivibrio alkaliphilus ACht1 TaxID=1313304 RepID=U7DD72_9BACT|nr:leucyl aminopeptidase family protein [Chitinivibrio alkaliphilus]ERP38826.1 Leucyl aminopeptidase [Chitinivibrio alkaliphilus ACht1]